MLYSSDSRIYPVNKLTAVVDAMSAEGIPVDLALQGTGVSAQELKSPETRLAVSQLLAAYRNALMHAHDPAFAVRLGRNTHVTTYGIYGYALLSAPNQRAIIDLAVKYHRLMLATADLSFRQESEANAGIWTIEPLAITVSEPKLYRFVVEVNLGSLAALSDDVLERPDIRKEIRLAYPRSPDLPAYEEFFRCPVHFEHDCNELRIDTRRIDEPIRRHNELTFLTMQKTCAELLEKMGPTSGVARELQMALLESAGRFPAIDAVCQRLGTSPRTLRRKLKAEGTSYGAIVNETRIGLAKRYLRETLMNVEEIASRVGYSDVSNFRRAFQRSTRVTPGAYRRALP